MTDFGLSNTVYSAKTLFNPVWVPWQVIVNHQMCALQIYAFTSRVSSGQNINIFIVCELFLSQLSFFSAYAAMDNDNSFILTNKTSDFISKILEGVFMLRKYNEFAS